jgi:hypothetical protein
MCRRQLLLPLFSRRHSRVPHRAEWAVQAAEGARASGAQRLDGPEHGDTLPADDGVLPPLAFLLSFLQGAPEPVRLSTCLDDVRAVRDPIE